MSGAAFHAAGTIIGALVGAPGVMILMFYTFLAFDGGLDKLGPHDSTVVILGLGLLAVGTAAITDRNWHGLVAALVAPGIVAAAALAGYLWR